MGYWRLNVPAQVLNQSNQIHASVAFADKSDEKSSVEMPYLMGSAAKAIILFPLTADNALSPKRFSNPL